MIKGVNLMEETVGGLMQRVRDCMSSSLTSFAFPSTFGIEEDWG